jgi:hypothetical protein
MWTIVLDINGVLADVRKMRAPPVSSSLQCDLVIPSGQKVYMRPDIDLLFKFFYAYRDRMQIVLWTSRKKVNAKPIENLLRERYGFEPSLYLHGEDCKDHFGYHPGKNSSIVRREMRLKNTDQIIFVDDSPERIIADANTRIVKMKTFCCSYATSEGEDRLELAKVASSIHRIINNIK